MKKIKIDGQMLYTGYAMKIVSEDGIAFHANFIYDLPTRNPDGSWTPGEWTRFIKSEVKPCIRGYHLTGPWRVHNRSSWLDWLKIGYSCVYIAEYRSIKDPMLFDGPTSKIVVNQVRLVECLGNTHYYYDPISDRDRKRINDKFSRFLRNKK